jgi:hypothetical protein
MQQMLLKRLIVRILQFFNYNYQTLSVFHHPGKKVSLPSYLFTFEESQRAFLELSAHSFNYQVDYSLGFRQKEVFTVLLPKVTFLGNSGGLVYQHKLITESVFDTVRLSKSPAFRFPALLWSRKKEGRYTSLMHLPWAETSNYHWFVDALPRLCLLLNHTEEIKLIVPAGMPAFQRQTLDFLLSGKSNITLVSIPKREKWLVEEFLFPSFIAHHNSGYLPPPIIQLIRQKVWQGYGVQESRQKKRLFISRAKTSKRRILNEEALIRLALVHGFQVVWAEDLSYQQQVQLFHQAEVVVGAHGAGLTNILFSEKCTLVELHPANQVKSHYFMLCQALGFAYHYLVGTLPDERWNFQVPEEAFSRLLNQILSTD